MDYINLVPVTDYGIPEIGSSAFASTRLSDHVTLPTVIITRSAVKIARAKSGETEIRLVSVLADGVHSKYQIEYGTLRPYASRNEEVKSRRKKKPASEADALAAFEEAVSKQYPSLPTRGGKAVATHLNIL